MEPARPATAVPWSCSSPTAGIAANRASCATRSPGCSEAAIDSMWLNPLIGTADYAPLTRGLQAALPFVDDFLPVRTLDGISRTSRYT